MMDLSPQFAVMCEKAEELQGQWERRFGDFCAGSDSSRFVITHGVLAGDDHSMEPYRFKIANITGHAEKSCWQGHVQIISSLSLENFYWLPRVDQLIALLLDQPKDAELTRGRRAIVAETILEYQENATTFEQSLLAAYMHRYYGKRWDWQTHSWTKTE